MQAHVYSFGEEGEQEQEEDKVNKGTSEFFSLIPRPAGRRPGW
jgi:hypothetical protein